jgi:conjugative relaxase-like TrwC/TraI family protein
MRTVTVMLSTKKIGTGSWRYYSNQVQHGACEYYLGVGEAPGRWYGRGLDALGLEPKAVVAERELEALFGRALHPKNRQQLGSGWRTDGVTGYDLCFSAPKSVSVLWALGEDTVPMSVTAAHRTAVTAALRYLDSHAAFSRIGTNGHTQVATEGLAAAVFPHRTSRAGEPQLHSHALVVNKVRCPDGEWRTIDGHEIYGHKKSAGVVYQAVLRNELTRRLGVGWAPVSRDGQAEIAGIPKDLMKAWSTRTEQVTTEAGPVIAAYETELGRPLTSAERTAVEKVAVIKTRPGKDPVDIVALTDRWDTEAQQLGWDGLSVQRQVGAAAGPRRTSVDLAEEMNRAVTDAVVAAGKRRAVFTRSDLVAEIAARFPSGGIDADTVLLLIEQLTNEALNTPETVPLRPHTDGPSRASDTRYACRTTLNAELDILAVADTGRGQGVAVIDPERLRRAAVVRGLDGSQEAALAQVMTSGDAVSVLVAPAGTGKTTALGAAVAAWQQAGHRVVLLAPSARAAAELRDATGTPADTVAKLLYERANPPHNAFLRPPGRFELSPGDVVVVDEASMLATGDLHALTQLTWAAGAKLVLVGDPAQIGAVDAAGGMLPALAERLGAPTLETVHRFTEPWERHASLRLRQGDPTVINEYQTAGRVHDCPDDTTAYQSVLTAYLDATEAGRQALMLARTRHDVDELNALARAQAIDTGQVHGPVLVDGDLPWQAGDRLRATRNNRTITVGGDYLRNGDQFIVTGTDSHGLRVQALDTGVTATLPAGYVAEHTAYGWASTIDAAQGATVDDAILLARPGIDREHLYVGLTRGRDTNHVYIAQPVTDTDHHTPPRLDDHRTAHDVLSEALRTSQTQHAAHTQLPNGPERDRAKLVARPAMRRPQPTVAWPPQPAPARARPDDYLQRPTHDSGRDLGRGR